jgi:hypothetical protein
MDDQHFVPPPPSPPHGSEGSDKVVVATNGLRLKFKPTRQIAEFVVLTVLCLTIISFCVAMIALGDNNPFYFSTITLIIGVYTPQPQLLKSSPSSKQQKQRSLSEV